MKPLLSFIYVALMVFALVSSAGFRFWEGDWFIGLIMLFVLFWNGMIYFRKWKYPFWE